VLADLIGELKARGIKPLVYFRCYIAEDAALTEVPGTFSTAVQNDYLVRTDAGTPYLFGSTFVAGVAGLLDVTNPEAVAWYQGRVRELLDMGAEGFMQDFGEQVFFDMRFDDGSSGVEMHNRYPVDFHRITRELLDSYEASNPGREVWFFTRAAFSGRPGANAYEGGNFPGDETTDWSRSSGLPSIVPDMLNRQVTGSYGYTTDIGGYLDYTTGTPTAELFGRWAQARR
jgi:alpha-D-xyloside xylohydrolase